MKKITRKEILTTIDVGMSQNKQFSEKKKYNENISFLMKKCSTLKRLEFQLLVSIQ